jgi:hypothetical protein
MTFERGPEAPRHRLDFWKFGHRPL